IDKTAPVVSLSGVTDGSFVNTDVTPIFNSTDANLASTVARLNGAAFTSGTVIPGEGNYLLEILATDKAGNATPRSAGFVIDKTKPVIAIEGVEDASIVNHD